MSHQTLISFLRENITHKSKNNIKTLITNKHIQVDNQIIAKPQYLLHPNQTITITNQITKTPNINLNVIYEDQNIIVVDKPTNLLTISNQQEKERTLYHEVSNYLKQKKQKVFIIHRLDKDTSGIIMFAKNQKIQKLYQDSWNTLAITREYTAVVEGTTSPKGHIESYLKQTKNLQVYSSKNKDGLFAITDYEQITNNNQYSLIKVHIKTGRRNQIRCHLNDIGHPIIGDTKYHSHSNPIKRLGLHANKLVIKNPITNQIQTFESPIPTDFQKIFSNK